jgi:alpha-ribazole phosphatase
VRLFLIRHPRTSTPEGICYGRSDVPLADDAASCAERLRPLLPADAPVFASPLARCRQLAEHLHTAPTHDDRLREIDFGAWEMRGWEDIGRPALDAWAADPLLYAGHGGESVARLHERVGDFLVDLARRHDEAVLVTHAGVMKAIFAIRLALPLTDWFSLRFDYGRVSLVEDNRLVWSNRAGAEYAPS